MKHRAAAVAVLAVALGWLVAPRASPAVESTALRRCQRAGEILASIEPEIEIERAIFAEELERGAASGAWSAEEKETALARMHAAFALDAPVSGYPPVPLGLHLAHTAAALTEGDPTMLTAPLLIRLGQRIEMLRTLRLETGVALREAALDFAEQTWLAAEKPADLALAIQQLTEARAATDGAWAMTSVYRGTMIPKRPPNFQRIIEPQASRGPVDIYDFLSVLASRQPFFLPDPIRDPAGFAAGDALWPDLAQIGHAFTQRPAIVERHREYSVRRTAQLRRDRAALEALIVRNAPAAEFEPPYLRYLLLAKTVKPPPAETAAPQDSTSPHISDYRSLAEHARSSPGYFRRLVQPYSLSSFFPEIAAYRDWLELRKAEPTGDAARIRIAREKLFKSRNELQRPAYAWLVDRMGADSEKATSFSRKATPVDALLAKLRGICAADKDHALRNGDALIATWEALRAGGEKPDAEDSADFQNTWATLATMSGSHALFALRDRAARQLLVRLYSAKKPLATSTTPLATALRARLAAAIISGSADLTTKLLALDAAGNFLPPTEHLAWARDAAMLRNAATLLAADQRAAARTAYLQAIQQLSEPALGEFAARQALRLRSTPPAKVP